MDIVVVKKEIHRLLEVADRVADKKSAVPAVANVLLVAEHGKLRVSATDLYHSLSGTCDAEVSAVGSIGLPAKDLFERVKAMPEGPVQISTDAACKATVKAVGQARRFSLFGLPGADFPLLPAPAEGSQSATIPVELFSAVLTSTHFSISTAETRAHMNSLYVQFLPGEVLAVSTDGHRLTKMTAKFAAGIGEKPMLIPLKSVSELRRLLDQARSGKIAEFQLQRGGDFLFVQFDRLLYAVKLTDAQFPPFEQVIPKSGDLPSATVGKGALVDALRATALASDHNSGVTLSLNPGMLRITSKSPAAGEAFDEIPVDYSGPEMKIGLNAKYVQDALGGIHTDDVKLLLRGDLDPMVVTPATEDGSGTFLGVVMPMRT